MKISKCYNCGTDKHTFYAEENGFSLVKCSECGLLYVDERLDDKAITQAHMQGQHTGLKELNVTGRFADSKIPGYLKVLEDIFEGNMGGIKTWLDVGCGHGEFMVALHEYSHGRIALGGTEPNIHKQESARKRGLNVKYIDIETHEEKYDAISLLNVYSHLPNPPVFLGLLKKCLNPGGSILLQTGDTADFLAKDHYKPFILPDHLSFASERIVVDILNRLGFDILKVRKYPWQSFNLNMILKEIVKAILPHYQSRIRNYHKRKLYSQTDMYIWARLRS